MSDPREGGGGVSGLEEVFTSRAFVRSRPVAVGGAPDPVVQRLFVLTDDTGTDGPLEEVFLSAQFGRPLTLVRSASGTETVVVPFPALAQRGHYRYRAVAAFSGIAAAALVVAGVSSGPGLQRPSDIAAQAPRFTSLVPGGWSAGAPGGSSPGIAVPGGMTLADTGTSAPTPAAPAGEPLRSDASSNTAATGSGDSGASVPVITSPAAPAGGGSSGSAPTGSGAGSSAPSPPASGNPVAPVATALGSTVATVSASVTSAAGQVASSSPAVASSLPVLVTATGAFTGIDANVVGVAQAMSSTTP